jgi:hypothetical protein
LDILRNQGEDLEKFKKQRCKAKILTSENMENIRNSPLVKKTIVSYKPILSVQIMAVCGGVLIFQRNGDLLAI